MVPNWRFEEARSKHAPSITLYESGALRGLRLAKPSLVKSPIGPLPAERLTFYESGALKRLFPVDGGLSGFWSLADEKKLNRKIRLGLKFGTYDLFVSGLAFYETGQLRSVTVWPGENPLLPLPISGAMAPVGAGFSLFPNGDLQSLEPRRPFKADTPLGPMEAFDPEATGITADKNSLAFGLDGKVTALKSLVIVEADTPSGPIKIFPNVKPSPLSDGQKLHLPLSFAFAGDTVTVSRGFPNGQAITLPLSSPIRLRPYYDHALTGIALPRPPLKPSRPI
jgi:hypothetical protein